MEPGHPRVILPHRGTKSKQERGGDKEARWEAALWLEAIGPPAKEAVPALGTALSDAEERARSKAVEALGALRSSAT